MRRTNAATLAERLDAMMEPYGVPNVGGLGREHAASRKPGDKRTDFMIDRNRIAYSDAMRRMEKTQVYSPSSIGSHLPAARWSHSLEVSNLAEDIALEFGVNHELARAIGLGHDLGQSPFGHEGEYAVHDWGKKHNADYEHNTQAVHIVTQLENHALAYRGLNLRVETIDGLRGHETEFDRRRVDSISDLESQTRFGAAEVLARSPSVEAQIVNYADVFCWLARDVQDGIALGILDRRFLTAFELYRAAEKMAQETGAEVRSCMVTLLASDLYETSQKLLDETDPKNIEEIYTAHTPLVAQSEEMKQQRKELTKYMLVQMYRPESKAPFTLASQEVLRRLCDHYFESPNGKVLYFEKLAKTRGDPNPRARGVIDFVSGLSDAQAQWIAKEYLNIPMEILAKTQGIFRA